MAFTSIRPSTQEHDFLTPPPLCHTKLHALLRPSYTLLKKCEPPYLRGQPPKYQLTSMISDQNFFYWLPQSG